MKISHCLSVAALIFGLSGMARASNIDFRMSVLDGPVTGDYITDTSQLSIAFGNCPPVGPAAGALGCFLGVNATGGTITSLDLTFADTVDPNDPNDFVDFLNGQTPDCQPSVFFSNTTGTCALVGSTYVLDFTGGTGIPAFDSNGDPTTFYIAEYDALPGAFQDGTLTPTISYATPEPSSILLLATGIGMLGIFAIRQRKSNAQAPTIW